MATATITANLNGGDSVTTNDNLIFKVYAIADNYTSPIHTTGTATADPNVSISGDVVTITGVDIALQKSFRITATDQALNESDLSNIFVIDDNDLGDYLGADLLLWLKDSTDLTNLIQDGTNASEWADASGNNHKGVQLTPANQPLLDNDGLLFDGIDDIMTVTIPLTNFELFFIVNQKTWSISDRLFEFVGAPKLQIFQSAQSPNIRLYSYSGATQTHSYESTLGIKQIITASLNGADFKLMDLPNYDIGVANNSTTSINIGNRAEKTAGVHAVFQEIIITNPLTAPQRAQVMARLESLL